MAIPDIKFQISPFSSTRFVNENPVYDPSFNTRPFDDAIDGLDYFQKVQKNDSNFRVWLLSAYDDVALKLYTCDDKLFKTVELINGPVITDAPFLIYKGVVDFSDVDPGSYYLKLTYTDNTATIQDLRSAPLDVEELHEGTLAYDYTNTFNDKGVVFINDDNSLEVFRVRVEGSIDEYQPLSDDVEFIDQYHDIDVLNNTPYDQHKNYIGTSNQGGIPDWLIKKMNLIFTLNKVQIDGVLFAKVEGSKFTPTRPDSGYLRNGNILVRPTFWVIEIQPNDNFFQGQFSTGPSSNSDIIVIKKAKTFDNVGADFSVAGLFTDNTNLIRLAIINKNQDTFTLKLGTTAGGSEIATIVAEIDPVSGVVPLVSSNDIGHPFTAPTEVFISGINGTNLKLTFDYNQYDAAPINPPANGTGGFVKGTLYIYYERTPGDFALDWDAGSGQGKRDFLGCSLAGFNGVPDRANKYSRGWDKTVPTDRGQEIGAPGNLIAIEKANLPAEGLAMFDNSVNTTRGDIPTTNSNVARSGNPPTGQYLNYESLKGRAGQEPTLGLTAKMGDGDHIDISPDSIADVYFGFIGV
jgi:hypothetical protein